jgi:diguanylate cyclase (GGDEF)-like protein
VAQSVDVVSFRQSLLQLLEATPSHEEQLLAEFEQSRPADLPLYSTLFSILAHLSFSEPEARVHWKRVARHRARLTAKLRRDPGLRVAILDYFVNVSHELKSPTIIEISIYERTARSAVTDGLTGLYNHAYLLEALRKEVLRSRRHELKLSLVLIDIDDFKKINDTKGHVEGDRVLVRTAQLVRESLREIDTAARYGGEEFAVLLPETSRTGAYVVAERIRSRIQTRSKSVRGSFAVTVSGGVATFPDDATSREDLVRRADEGLYRSKASGKNRISTVAGERRRYRRVPASHVVLLSGGAGRRASARTRNMSEGGVLLRLKEPVREGAQVNLVIRSEGTDPVDLRGEVVRVEPVTGGKPRQFDVAVRLLTRPPSSEGVVLLRRAAPAVRA